MSFFFKALRGKVSEDDLVDLHNKVVVITGGNSGIGFTTIQFLARKGAKVYMACRREEAYKTAVARLEEGGLGDGSVHWLQLNLSDPKLVKSAAQELLEREGRLDILINNAAKGHGPFGVTKYRIQEAMVINYLSHFVFTETLLPLLVKTSKEEGSDVRILSLTSTAHEGVKPTTFAGKESWNIDYGNTIVGGLKFYGLSKVGIILHVRHLQQRLEAEGSDIICMAIDPGAVSTENVASWVNSMSWWFSWIVWLMAWLTFTSPREGAMNSAYAAASPKVKASAEKFKGTHLTPVGRITAPSSYARDDRLAKELYETSLDIMREMDL